MFYEDDEVNDQLSNQPVDYMTYDQIYEEALIKASNMYFKALNMDDPREMLAIGEAFHHEASPLLLHFIMFLVCTTLYFTCHQSVYLSFICQYTYLSLSPFPSC